VNIHDYRLVKSYCTINIFCCYSGFDNWGNNCHIEKIQKIKLRTPDVSTSGGVVEESMRKGANLKKRRYMNEF
jgi:hypothetical protein